MLYETRPLDAYYDKSDCRGWAFDEAFYCLTVLESF